MDFDVADINNIKKVIEFFPDGILVLDRDQRILFANKEAERIFKKNQNALRQIRLKDLFFSANDFFTQVLLAYDYITEEAHEVYARRSDGSTLSTSIKFKVNEEFNYFFCSIRDISSVCELRRDKIATIVSSSEDAIISKDLNGRILSWNKGAEKLFQYKEKEVIGKPISIIIPDEKMHEEEIILDRIKEEIPERLETFRKRKDGSFVYVSVTIFPLKNKHGKIIGAAKIARDNTERINLLSRLQNQNRQLEEFTHIIAHNFRAPISNIQSLLQFYNLEKDFYLKEMYMSKLHESVEGLNETFNDLIEVLYIQHEEKKLVPVNFKKVFDKVIANCEGEIKNSNAVITCDFLAAEEIFYLQTYLESILQNLITNAIKYRYPNRRCLIHVKTKKAGDKIVLSVKDNGLGIDLERYSGKIFGFHKIFHKHPQAKGVGLYIIKTQVESMGGKITVESEVDKGSEFKVVFS